MIALVFFRFNEVIGMKVCVVKGWLSMIVKSKICWSFRDLRLPGKQEKRLVVGGAGHCWETDSISKSEARCQRT